MLLCATFFGLKAQKNNFSGCATDRLHQLLFEKNEGYRATFEQLEFEIARRAELLQENPAEKKAGPVTYTLPVAVHIVTPPGTPIGQGNNLTDAQVEDGLELLNQAFANQGAFQIANGVDVGISFCLARRDPEGKPTSGVTRHESTLVADAAPCSPFGTNSANDAAIKNLVNWDCENYINIWLVTDLYDGNFGCSLAGFAYFPGAPCNIDGIIQESQYWVTVGGTQVTAHEMGHYFSLNHTFLGGCANNNCLLDGDRVCDTPPDASPSFAPCGTNSCNSDVPDLPDDNTNFMDYTSCMPLHFTDGQRVRMISGLELGRASLINSQGCLPVVAVDAALSQIEVAGCASKAYPTVFIKNSGLSVLTSLSISYEIDGGANNLFNWAGSLAPNATANVALPCVASTVGQHTISVSLSSPNGGVDDYLANNNLTATFTQVALTASFDVFSFDGFTKKMVSTSTGATQFLWDFGDGQTSTEASPVHTYSATGDFTIILTVKNDCGETVTVSHKIQVTTCIPGWRGRVQGLNNYIEPDEAVCDMVKNGELHIAPNLSSIGYYWTAFDFCHPICVGNNFTLQVRLKNAQNSTGEVPKLVEN